jgi:hypothetical protein
MTTAGVEEVAAMTGIEVMTGMEAMTGIKDMKNDVRKAPQQSNPQHGKPEEEREKNRIKIRMLKNLKGDKS